MAQKRFFIGVGSTALGALTALVNRYRDCGELLGRNPDSAQTDFFLGYDSDVKAVEAFNELDKNRDHLCGVEMHEDEEMLALSHEIRNDWGPTDRIEKDGVGGARRKSFRTLNLLDNPYAAEILNKIGEGDLVVLVGSAFGGTSTGAYWNLATYLREFLNAKEPKFNTLYGFVVFPDIRQWEENFSGGNVRTSYEGMSSNVCNFLRDMGEQRILLSILHRTQGGGGGIRFVPLSLALSKKDHNLRTRGGRSFGVLKGESLGASVPSNIGALGYLPTETVFLISTNGLKSGKAVSALVAEEIFLFARLGMGLGKDGGGTGKTLSSELTNSGPKNKHGAVGECFAELNFIAARTLKKPLLAKFFYEHAFQPHMAEFGASGSSQKSISSDWKAVVQEMKKEVLGDGTKMASEEKTIEKYVEELLHPTPTGDGLDEEGLLRRVARLAAPFPLQTPKDFLASTLSKYLVRTKKDGGQGGANRYGVHGGLPFQLPDVRALHAEIFRPIQEAGATKKEGGSTKKAHERYLGKLKKFQNDFRAEMRERNQLPFWTRTSGKTKENLERELKDQGVRALCKLLEEYLWAERCERTAFDTKVDLQFEQLRERFAAFGPEWTDLAGETPCISRPKPTPEVSGELAGALVGYLEEIYQVSDFYEDALKIVQGAFSLPIRTNEGVKRLEERIDDKNNPIVLPPGLQAQMTKSTFDGIEGVSGTPVELALRESTFGDGRNSNFKLRFMIDFNPGEKTKTGNNGLPRPVTYHDIHKLARGWEELFSRKGGADSSQVFVTTAKEDPFASFGNWGDVRLIDKKTESQDRSYADMSGFWLGVLHIDRSLGGFWKNTYHQYGNGLEGEMVNCLEAEKEGDYGRLLHYEEAVQLALVLGAMSDVVQRAQTSVNTEGGVKYWVKCQDGGMGGASCVVPVQCIDHDRFAWVTLEMAKWAWAFVKSHALLFEDEATGAKAFFDDLKRRENRVLLTDPPCQLDFHLKANVQGAESLETLKAVYDSIVGAMDVEVKGV